MFINFLKLRIANCSKTFPIIKRFCFLANRLTNNLRARVLYIFPYKCLHSITVFFFVLIIKWLGTVSSIYTYG